MGYIIGGIVFVLGVVIIAFLLSSRSGRVRGRIAPAGATPVERSEPSAEQATPAASSIADEGTARRAQDRTPPA